MVTMILMQLRLMPRPGPRRAGRCTAGMPQARSNAAATLYLLSTLEGVREELLQAGAVPALVKLLEEGNDQGKKDAANCLLSICLHKDNRKDVAEVRRGGSVFWLGGSGCLCPGLGPVRLFRPLVVPV